jgi:hypothetical protein
VCEWWIGTGTRSRAEPPQAPAKSSMIPGQGFPITTPHPHMGSKKNKVKKVFAPSPAAPNNTDNLVDEHLTELNSRDETVQREFATVQEEIQTRQ